MKKIRVKPRKISLNSGHHELEYLNPIPDLNRLGLIFTEANLEQRIRSKSIRLYRHIGRHQ